MKEMLTAVRVLDLALSLIEVGSAAYLVLMQRRAELQLMIAQHRDPTAAEWDALLGTLDRRAAHILQSDPPAGG